MKIVEQTHTRLKIQHRPFAMWFLGGFIFISGFGLLIYSLFFEFASASLSCQRVLPQEINCDLRRSSLLGRRERLRIFDISNAYVRSMSSGRSRSYRVIIETPLGERYMIENQSRRDNERVAQEIKNFLFSNQGSVLVEQNQRNFLFFVQLFTLFLIADGIFLMTKPVSHCTFYKSLNQLFIERHSLRVKEIIEEPLENILRIDIQDKQFKYGKKYQAVILLKSYREIPINLEYIDETTVRKTVFRINDFLGYDTQLI
jgi:hypothetical protein